MTVSSPNFSTPLAPFTEQSNMICVNFSGSVIYQSSQLFFEVQNVPETGLCIHRIGPNHRIGQDLTGSDPKLAILLIFKKNFLLLLCL